MSDPFLILDHYAEALLAAFVRWAGGTIRSPLPRHRRLVQALAAAAAALDAGLLGGDAAGAAARRRAALLDQAPELAAHVALLEHCATSLGAVLSGEKTGTDVLFPGGTMDLVARIYDGTAWTDHFNGLAAEAVARMVEALVAEDADPVRILEIGAGTGGTARPVLQALDRFAGRVAYDYTDISPGFAAHGQMRFGKRHPFARFRTLDIEKAPVGQGFAGSAYHVVLATNVLHATRRIDEALGHVAALLAPGGALVLNEVTRASLFGTLTFGLLDGWWRFDDAGMRLPGAPLLDRAGWVAALDAAGFATPACFGWQGAADSFQTLFVAEWTGAAAAPPARAVPAVASGVAPVVARVLGLDPAEIEPDRPLAELGVDSIVAAQLATALAESLGVAVAPSEIYDAATVAGLERHVAGLPALPAAAAVSADVEAFGAAAEPDRADGPDDIAVIGIACRFPGAADREAFWRNLVDGVCSITEVPAARWDWRPHFAVGRGEGRIVSRWGGFLDGHDLFDPEPFRITHGEARAMSPQQRLFLETAWHALEDAGYGRTELGGTKCGVFVGVAPDGWGGERADARSSLGDSNAILSARLAYALDLKGACLPIDTACSSSLVAVHMAARSLLSGDTTMALAGGVSVLMGGPRLHAFLSDSGMASPTGLCRSFDAGADGFVPGEGVGVVVLKRLDRARAEGDQIYAVIKASGVNQDGTTSGITAPSGAAQTALEREVYARGGIDARRIGLVEAHGTGTQLGDPIEVKALVRAFRADTEAVGFCRIGSVKSNIGHTLTAAGIAGFIKAALAVGRGLVPPSLHYRAANPEIDFAASPFRVPTTAERWSETAGHEEAGYPRLAAVSSFGFSGTNAHVVLAEPPPRRAPAPRPGLRLVAVSAKTAEALDRRLADLADCAAAAREPFPWLAWTATVGRTHFEHRAAILAGDGGAFSEAARALAENRASPLGRRVVVSARQETVGGPVVPETPAMAAEAFLAGRPADLAAVFDPADRIRISLPLYPFERLRFPGVTPGLEDAVRSGRHPFVGSAEESPEGRRFPLIGADRWPGLADHRHVGRAIWPAAALIEAIWAVGRSIGAWGEGFALEDLAFVAPLALGDPAWLVAEPAPEGGGLSLRLSGAGGRLHASGRLRSAVPTPRRRIDLAALGLSAGRRMDAGAAYGALAAVGFDYGPAFRMLRGVTVHQDRVLAELAPDDAAGFDWPPGRTDAAIQAAVGLVLTEVEPRRMTVLPAGVAAVRLHDPLAQATQALVERRVAEPGRVQLDISLLDPDGRLLAELVGFQAAIRPEAAETADAVLAYEPVWLPAGPPFGVMPADADGFAVLCRDGEPPPGAGARQILQPCADAAAWQARFGALAAAGMLPDRIADLRPLAGPSSAGADASAAEAAIQSVIAMLSGWLLAVPGRPLRLIRAYRTEGETVPAEAALEGLAAALAQEAPELSVSLLGLDAAAAAAPMAALASAFARPVCPHTRVLRDALTVRGWRLMPPATPPAVTWPDRPVVIVTGAQGGLGQASAEHLARTRQARLVLLSRRSAAVNGPHLRSDLARRIARLGGEAVDVTADVATPAGARHAVEAALTAFGRVDGVIHAAGVTRDGMLRGRAAADVAAVLAPKVAGTEALLAALAGQPVRAFICYGSLAAVFGNAGQGDYGAANAFIGALAEHRGLPLVTIDWPFWRDGRLKARDSDDTRLRQATGTRWLETAEGLAMLDLALVAGRPRLAVAAGSPRRIAALFAGETPPAPIAATADAATDRLAFLRDLLAEVTGAPRNRLQAEREIEALALDSMHVMQLNDRLGQVFGRISKTLFYECRTLGEVAARLPVTPAPAEPRRDDRGAPSPRPAGAEPIAIIGMAGRFPGADDLDSYWANLLAGRDCVTEIPATRWDHSLVFDPTPGRRGKAYSRWGGFLSQVDGFDPLFFGIAPAEAEGMDPQERLALETAWEAMEDAGLTRATLTRAPGRLGAVYIGVMYGDYQMLGAEQHARGNPVDASAPYWSIANRLSYAFDLRGPSLAVDSACSSSLTALHLACRSLWSGEAEIALAGGVNLSLHPLKYVGLSEGRFASTDGRCRSFGAGGDGYVPGEGVAIAILKPLAAARADGDRIHGVIRGSAINHGGRTNGYTVPSPAAQAEAVRGALAAAAMGSADIDYVEAHGTGTALGDPIEIEGLGRLFAAGADAGACPVGTVKSAIGHLEAAAGMAGLAKLLLQFRHATLAPTLLHGGANPAIDFAAAGLRLVTAAEAWRPRRPGRALTAGLSSFGAGGANAHLILEAPLPVSAPSAPVSGPFAFVLSARSLEQLQAYAARLRDYCGSADAAPADVARTLQIGREAMPVRLGFLADDLAEAADRLARWLRGDRHAVDWHVPADETTPVPAFDPAFSQPAVLSAWVRGASVPWAALDWPGRRVFVPPHPFMRRRYWPQMVGAADGPLPAVELRLDPQSAVLHHHRVGGQALVPAAWLLAMARQAAGDGAALSDVVLHRPTAGGEAPILMRLLHDGASLRVAKAAGDVVLSADIAEAAPVLPIPPPADGGTLPPAEAYRRFAALGIDYGPSFRRLGPVVFDGQVAEAEIAPAATGDSEVTGLDAAMQAVIALIPEAPGVAGVPHRIDRVSWHADPQRHPIARTRARAMAADRFDIDGLSASGAAVVCLRGLQVRRLAPTAIKESPAILVPVWHEAAMPVAAELPRHLLILHSAGTAALLAQTLAGLVPSSAQWPLEAPDEDGVRAALLAAPVPVDTLAVLADGGAGHGGAVAAADQAERAALAFLMVARVLARCPAGRRPARLIIVTVGLHDVTGGDAVDPAGAALPAMARSLAAELPGLTVVLADVDAPDMSTETARLILAEAPRIPIVDVAWRGGRRFERRLVRVGKMAPRAGLPPEPVCIITGGGGGLGRALAAHLVARYGAQVVLCGRRPMLGATLPERVDYVPADLRDAAAVAHLADAVAARHGRIDAIIHAPLVLADRRLAQMLADDFRAAFAPKAAGTAHVLAAAHRHGARLVVFSSANVFAGAEGQANYVAGSAVQDALVRSAGGQAQVINWGLWGEIGAVADPATQARLAEAGILPIRPAEGFAALDRLLLSDVPQAAVVKAAPDALARLGLRAEPADLGAAIAGFDRLETYGRARLLAIWLAAVGEGGRAYTTAGLARRLGIAQRHERLFQALTAMLARHGLIETRDAVIRLPAPGADPAAALAEATAALDASLAALPWLARPRALLDAVLDRYGAVLAGAVDPLDVLFPGGSTALTEGAYRGNPLADAFNAAAAAAVAAHRHAAGAGWRAIEIGAGSGGTTGAILAALDQGAAPDGYLYTDLSGRFLAHGQTSFGQGRPWFTTALYDAEQTVEANGQQPGSFDAVIAANVLHATADIGGVLASLRRLLRPGGLLVMVELTAAQDYATLVFGLTEGWWKAADASRLAHSPVIDAAGWERQLAEAGFAGVERIDFAASGARGQAVFLASVPALAAAPAAAPAAAASAAPPPAGGDRLRQALLAHLRGVFGEVLRIDPAEMRATDSFEQYGLESLSATAIRDRLAARFGPVSPTLLFEHGTLAGLADHMLAERPAAVRDALGLAAEAPVIAVPAAAMPTPPAGPERAPAHQPIAIIGMAARFPGADGLDAFWRLLETGGSAIGPVPADRWVADGRSYTRWGGFLAEIDRFDPLFFGIAPADAAAIDPQERVFLETAWHAMEDAGYTPARLNAGGPVGVYVGVMNAGYQWLAAQSGAAAPATSAYWSIANRLSFVGDFAGPSLAVDTACSASLTALHLAVQALRTGDCAAAVVGGVNLILHPRQMANLCEARMLSAGPENRAFGAGADGFVDGEGVAALLLKPLDAALASGDRIAAVIRGTAANSGGKTAGFSVPNPAAQARVIAAALRSGGVAPESVGFVEAHGTGTALGDPIEVTGIAAAYGGGARPSPLALGALKANIGHLESAAGIAGVIKTVLQLRHGCIAPLRHAAQPNPLIDFAAAGCLVPQDAMPWPTATGPDGAPLPRRAGVSAFGAGGANAHAILEEAPLRMRATAPAVARDILVLSAADAAALKRVAAGLRTAFGAADPTPLADRLHTLRVGRRAFPLRVAAVVTDAAAVVRVLDAIAAGGALPGLIQGRGTAVPSARPIEETPEGQSLLDAMIRAGDADGLAGLWVDGVTIDWSRLPWAAGCQVVSLPGYLFARDRYWLEATASPAKPAAVIRLMRGAWVPAPLMAGRAEPAAERGEILVLRDRDPSAAAQELFLSLRARARRPGRSAARLLVAAEGVSAANVAGLAAVARSAAEEGLRARILWLRGDLDPEDRAAILAEEAAATDDDVVIDRRAGRQRWSRHWLAEHDAALPRPLFRSGGRYLMVGGLGEVGRALAAQLAAVHGATIGIIGRTAAGDATRRHLDTIRGDSGSVYYAAADVTDRAALARAVGELKAAMGGIDGVLDLARLIDNAPIARKHEAAFADVLAVKASGTLHLDAVTAEERLDFFIVFSSLAAWFGLAGGADYAAACAIQEGLMVERAARVAAGARHGVSLAVAWPQWRYDAQLDAARGRRLDAAGLAMIDAPAGLAILARAAAAGDAVVAVVAGTAEALAPLAETDAPLPETPLEALSDEALAAYVDALRVAATPATASRAATTTDRVRDAFAAQLRVDPGRLDADSPFAEFGLDSIKALHVAERLSRDLGIAVEPAFFFDHPTVARLAEALDERRGAMVLAAAA